MRNSFAALSITIGILCTATSAVSQDISLGEFEYQNSCVACHGVSGKGDGPVTDFLSGAVVPDLTVLQENNGGVFPVTAVFQTLEGGDAASAHGTRDMPIWGKRFQERVAGETDAHFPASDLESYPKIRILALIEYLAGIQGK